MATQAITESHLDVRRLIYDVVWKFKRRHGGDLEDMVSVANEAFVDAYRSYSPDPTTWLRQRPGQRPTAFTTWLQIKIWRRLQDHLRDRVDYTCHVRLAPVEEIDERTPGAEDRWAELLVGLSDDAREVVRLISQPPPDIRREVRRASPGRYGEYARRAVADFLRDIGWATARIAETFKELSEAIG